MEFLYDKPLHGKMSLKKIENRGDITAALVISGQLRQFVRQRGNCNAVDRVVILVSQSQKFEA
jgi:hypothetical protein